MARLLPFVAADEEKCTDCRLCEIACYAAHNGGGKTAGCLNVPVLPRLYRRRGKAVPIQCKSCEGAPCAVACSRQAISFRHDRIWVDIAQCRSCPNCTAACPFDAIRLVPGKCENNYLSGNKCDLCFGLAESPACVAACPEAALRHILPEEEKRARNVSAAQSLARLRRN